jgi:hypothetical protein
MATDPITREENPVDAELRAYVRAFVTALAPGAMIALALAVAGLSGVLA